MNVPQKTKGFTIIEVVLVLAIAGLIFLMVFIALPALQRSQRDSARKNEVGTVASAITNYMSNNRNNIPEATDIGEYITGTESDELESGAQIIVRRENFNGPIGVEADISASANESDDNVYADQIKVFFGYKCDPSSNADLIRGTSKQAAVVVALESGPAGGEVYCQTN
jgi:prepilin-type N-terminal cleavage/methylation domain-containing protein